MSFSREQKRHLLQDFLVIGASILAAAWLVESGVLTRLLSGTRSLAIIESFLGGIFFTSAFTTAPAIVFLGELALESSIWTTALAGALGALCGDLILFAFVKDRFSQDLISLISQGQADRLRHIFGLKIFRWFSPFVAALIIASPLPDELGVMILGFARTRTVYFISFSFLANFLGILAVTSVAKVIAG